MRDVLIATLIATLLFAPGCTPTDPNGSYYPGGQPAQPRYKNQQQQQRPRCPGGRCTSMTLYETLPVSMRQKNWNDGRGGSCVIASLSMVAYRQGLETLGDALVENFSGPQSPVSTRAALNSIEADFAFSDPPGDGQFLAWVTKTNRGAIISFGRKHVQYFEKFADTDGDGRWDSAVIIDNNRPLEPYAVELGRFLREWKSFGGWATTFAYPPGGMPEPVRRLAAR